MLKNRLFLRIYTHLVVLVILVAIFCYFLVEVINHWRIQQYRESLTDGISYVVSERLARQNNIQQSGWLSDASYLLDTPVHFIRHEDAKLSSGELKRIERQQAVVRYDEKHGTQIIVGVKDKPHYYLNIQLHSISEKQIKALSIFVIDYLAEYPGKEQEYVKKISQHFSYDLEVKPLKSLNLDPEQIGRLKQDQSLLLYRDNTTLHRNNFYIVSPIAGDYNHVLVLGGIPIYNDMPLQLAAMITLLALLLLSLGVYGLILPLDRKTRQVSQALNKMQKGDLSVRLAVDGHDEMAVLARSYNSMVEHIQRLIEAQQELMRAVSHELRTPVARIRFGLEMLAEDEDSMSRELQVAMIDKDIEELNKLIDEIMTYAKLEQGTPSFEFEQIVLYELLEQVVNETEALKTQKNIELMPLSPELLVLAEYRYLHRVVQNLVGNAIRYADTTIRVSGGVLDTGEAFVCVEDDGHGIPEVDRQRIFEAFARLDDSRTRASGGYGLGLSIVGRIAYWFGGSVDVDDSPALGGARFTMKWPAHKKISTR